MIKPQDLRLGNYVVVKKAIIKVQAIDENGINSDPNFGHYGDMNYDAHFDDGLFHQTEIKPVPLTPEILEACGFESLDGTDQYRLKDCILHKMPEENEWELTGMGASDIHPAGLRDLHQLQNLYFTLTAKELDVKLNRRLSEYI